MLNLTWSESGGPEVISPIHKGFGSRLLEFVVRDIGGVTVFGYKPEGFRCTITATIERGSSLQGDTRARARACAVLFHFVIGTRAPWGLHGAVPRPRRLALDGYAGTGWRCFPAAERLPQISDQRSQPCRQPPRYLTGVQEHFGEPTAFVARPQYIGNRSLVVTPRRLSPI
jgi:hypothetical protein